VGLWQAEAGTLRRPARVRTSRRREALQGYMLLSPWLVGFLVFTLGPMIASLVLSLTDYSLIRKPTFVGMGNYARALTDDDLFWSSLGRTFYYAWLTVPLATIGAILLAALLNKDLLGTTIYRTFFFLPHLTPIVAAALLWKWILQPDFGPVNLLLFRLTGIEGPKWFGSPEWALPGLVIMSLWMTIGGNRMMVFLAGMQGVPQEYYEAAEIDGANVWHKFRHVTMPMISPTIFFNVVLGIIGALRVFGAAFIATRGGPAYATWFYALHIYSNAFEYFHMGYACALSWLFLLVMFFFTYIQFRSSARWVYYEGEVRG